MFRKLHVLIAAGLAAGALAAGPANATFPDDNGRIAFASGGEIYTIKSDGTGLVNVTNSGAYESDPAYSPHGHRLAYTRGPQGSGDVYVTQNNAGQNPTPLQASLPFADDVDPSWSPDGKKIAFGSNRDGDYEIYIAPVDGGTVQKLTENLSPDTQPTWSPDGSTIAYVCNDGDDEICTRPIDPSILGVKMTSNTFTDRRPNWSPDGQQIAYSSDRDGNYELYVQTGSTPLRVTNDAAFDSQPSWSPDGTAIVFASERLGAPRLFKYDLATSGVTPLGGDPGSSENPDWGGVVHFEPAVLPQKVLNVSVKPRGTFAVVEFEQRHPSSKALVELWTPSKKAGAVVKLQTAKSDTPKKSWSIKVTHLDPGTAYRLHIVAYKGAKSVEYVHPSAVNTLERRVVLMLNKVSAYDDSDWDNCGDFFFDFLLENTRALIQKDLCSPGTWTPGSTVLVAKDVKADVLQLRVLAVDEDSGPFGPPFVGSEWGAIKEWGDWAEGAAGVDVTPTSYTIPGEVRIGLPVKVTAKRSGGPNVVFRMSASVLYV